MKRVYSIILLLTLAVTVTTRVALLHQKEYFQISAAPKPVVSNATLLQYAAVEMRKPRFKQEIKELLEGDFNISSRRGRGRQGLLDLDLDLELRLRVRSLEPYRLWPSFRRYIRDWSSNRRFHPDVMSNLATEVKAPIDDYYNNNGHKGSSTPKYETCAVVGNSGILLKSNHGNFIDSHQAVIRLNNAGTKRFEPSVGSKTHISFVNSAILHSCARRQACFCHPYGPNVPVIVYMCRPLHFLDYLVCNASFTAPLIVTDLRFDVLCARIVKYYSLKRFLELTGKEIGEWASAHEGAIVHHSSGMQAIMLALGVCDQVSIFGFGKSKLAKHHYHDIQKAEAFLHDFEAEYDFYRDLLERPEAVPFVSHKFRFPPVVMYH